MKLADFSPDTIESKTPEKRVTAMTLALPPRRGKALPRSKPSPSTQSGGADQGAVFGALRAELATKEAHAQNVAAKRDALEAETNKLAKNRKRLERSRTKFTDCAIKCDEAGERQARDKMRELQSECDRSDALIPHLRAQLADAERAQAEHRFALDYAAGAAAKVMQGEIVGTLGEQFTALGEALGELAGLSRWRADVCGQNYTFHPDHRPLGGAEIARTIIAAIPESIRPPGLNASVIEARAAQVAQRIAAEIAQEKDALI